MTPNYEKLKRTLQDVFMLDKAELDFGIYRIMNQKRKEIEDFLEIDLLPQVKTILEENQSNERKGLETQLAEKIAQIKGLGYNPDENPVVQQMVESLTQYGNMDSLEDSVFSHLASFFKRYYDNGDFISMRRYKKDVYAIPYEGEEVKLHWANADQYYIKTSEYLKNYSFALPDGRKVLFELVEASTEQNNNKTQSDKERRFKLTEPAFREEDETKLSILFTYELFDKKVKQKDLNEESINTLISPMSDADSLLKLVKSLPMSWRTGLAEQYKTKTKKAGAKDIPVSWIEYHITQYTARNTFDYFIHKDLGGFLRRELDFYIKNEVLYIDDINTRNEKEFLSQLSRLKAIKKIGEKIIAFLAQLEDFQKKLWLKKKMVIDAQYCITLDRVPEEFYPEIAANDAQREEWVKLFAIDEIKKDLGRLGYTNPLTIEFLKENPFLVLDTAFFSEDFTDKLVGKLDNLDENTGGLLVNSENFQALNLLQHRYFQSFDTCYIDPPYNTDASPIMYKNNYQSSSWISLMDSRLRLSKKLIHERGILCATIDDFQSNELVLLLADIFGSDNILGSVAIRNNPSGRPTPQGFSISHEYGHFVRMGEKAKLHKFERSELQSKRYKERDENGSYMWELLRKRGTDSERRDSPKAFFPFYFNRENKTVRIPTMEWIEAKRTWLIQDQVSTDEVEVLPIDENGIERRWRWGIETARSQMQELKFDIENSTITVYYKYYEPEGVLPSTNWIESKYSATEHGTGILKHFFNEYNPFSFPKSVYAVEDSLLASGMKPNNTICIDYFAGSGTTGHALININRKDDGDRKFVLVEMGTYFNSVTKPRVQKVIYSGPNGKDNLGWKDGKPTTRKGISHIFKYLRLESYEDTLSNLVLQRSQNQQLTIERNAQFKEGYMLGYMLDVESRGSLLNLEWFLDPFNVQLQITQNNETKLTKINLVETFNYLIGLIVDSVYSTTVKDCRYKIVNGKNRAGDKILVIWRQVSAFANQKEANDALNEFMKKSDYRPLDREFDRIWVNGNNNIENLKIGEERWKVGLIEEEFGKRMFEEK
jgi:adenine-specific DNA-methyltransferase